MKKLILISIFTSFTSLIYAQNNGVSFGFEINPFLTLPIVDEHENFEHESQFGAAFTGLINLKFNSFYAIRSGIRLSAFQFAQKDYTLAFGCDHDGTGSYLPFNSWLENNYTLYYIGIPLENVFTLGEEKNRFYFKIGGSLLVNIGKSSEVHWFECGIDTGSSTQNFIVDPNSFLITTGAGLGYEFSIRNNRTLFIEPTVAYSITPLLDQLFAFSPGLNSPPKMKALNLGISMGINF